MDTPGKTTKAHGLRKRRPPARDPRRNEPYSTTPPAAGGYAGLLGLRPTDVFELRERVEAGLPFGALEHFQRKVGMSLADLADLVQIPLRTLTRRKESGRLQMEESDRLVRASRIFSQALELFEGDLEAAKSWLADPQPALGGVTPLAMARTGVGAREVEALIGRLEHGVFS
jgi:putative toxin-antitoxin system antitoxin component (TIGR02293 family)